MGSLENILKQLIKGENLTNEETLFATELIANGEAESHQVAAFLALLAAKQETSQEILSMAKVMRKHVTTIPIMEFGESNGTTDVEERLGGTDGVVPLLDIVGTGGDGFNTVNISTAASLVVSSCGVSVCKHGSTSVSSRSGSSDVLLELTREAAMKEETKSSSDIHDHIKEAGQTVTLLKRTGYCFYFAPYFHPAMKHVVPIRKALKVRTVFNILGPLLNPLFATLTTQSAGEVQHVDEKYRCCMVLGVYDKRLLPIFAGALKGLGIDHALVVHGSGMDELNTTGTNLCWEVRKGQDVKEFRIDPVKDLDVPLATVQDLKGGGPTRNAEIIRTCFTTDADLKEKKTDALERLRETIALNAGAGLYVTGSAPSIKEGMQLALKAMKSGKVLGKLDEISAAWNALERS